MPWSGSVVLSSAGSFVQSNGNCAFNVSYDVENQGTAATALPFSNALRVKDAAVAVNSNLSLDAGQTKQINTQPYLPAGDFALILQMDSGNTVTESSEANNLVYVKVNLGGTCGTPTTTAKADLVSQHGITIGGKFVACGGTVALQAADASIRSKDKCVFGVVYDVANIGSIDAGSLFVDSIYSRSSMVGQQTVSSLNAGQSKQFTGQVAIAGGTNHIYLLLDANNNIVESNKNNNATYVTTTVDSCCAAGTTQTTTK